MRVQRAILDLAAGNAEQVAGHLQAAQVRDLLRRADTDDVYRVADIWRWPALRPLAAELLPLLAEQYRVTCYWQARAALLYHATALAPEHDAAIELGIEALADRSLEVRYRACGLLAYGKHDEAAPHLARLARGEDEQSARYAAAALKALSTRNLAPCTALDVPRRRFHFLPPRGPCRAEYPTFAEELDASARPWLLRLGFEPQGVLGHDAFYRAGDIWLHAGWDQWDVVWLFHLGPRDKLESCPLQKWLRKAGVKEAIPGAFDQDGEQGPPSSRLRDVCGMLERALPPALAAARSATSR
jgi:hypothetical protein